MGEKLATRTFSDQELNLLKSTIVPSNATEDEIKLFVLLSKKYNLDPFTKEIVMTKYNTKNGPKTSFITTRDGYLKIAMSDPDFDGVVSFVVKEGDEFEVDAGKLEVKHRFGSKRGQIIGAWAIARHKKRPPVIVFVDFKEYCQTTAVWEQYPSAMIQKVAEVAALRRQFNISGLVAQEELRDENHTEMSQKEITPPQLPETQPEVEQRKATEKQIKMIHTLITEICRLTETPRDELANEIKQRYGVSSSKDLTIEQASKLIEELQKQIEQIQTQLNGQA
jgi:phage recombination protein Bet